MTPYNWCMLSSRLSANSRLSPIPRPGAPTLKNRKQLTQRPPGYYGAVTHPWPLITAMSSTLLWLLSVSCLKLTSVCLYTGFLLCVDTRGSRSENYLYLKEQKDFPLSQDPRSTHLFCVCPWATITISQFPALRARQHGSRLKM